MNYYDGKQFVGSRRNIKFLLFLILSLGFVGLVAGCETQDQISENSNQRINVTSQGITKIPTKFIETPQGTREVYDPVNDSNIREVVKKLIHLIEVGHTDSGQHGCTGEVSANNIVCQHYQIIDNAQRAQKSSLQEAGCKQIQTSRCDCPENVPCFWKDIPQYETINGETLAVCKIGDGVVPDMREPFSAREHLNLSLDQHIKLFFAHSPCTKS